MESMKLKKNITYGVILIIVGISFLLKDFVVFKREEVFTMMNLELSESIFKEEPTLEENTSNYDTSDNDITDIEMPSASIKKEENTYEAYAGYLDIDKIGFSRGFYKKDSKLNNVKYNIKIEEESDYPGDLLGNVIIIGHSGNYNNSYFANLYKLEVDDTAVIRYKGISYTYKIVNIYTDTKDGTVTIYRDKTKNCLTLITCTKDDSKTQTIYIFELMS